MHQNIQLIHIKVCWLKICEHIGGLCPTICGLFLLLCQIVQDGRKSENFKDNVTVDRMGILDNSSILSGPNWVHIDLCNALVTEDRRHCRPRMGNSGMMSYSVWSGITAPQTLLHTVNCNIVFEANNDIISSRFVEPVVPDNRVQFGGPRATNWRGR